MYDDCRLISPTVFRCHADECQIMEKGAIVYAPFSRVEIRHTASFTPRRVKLLGTAGQQHLFND